MTFSKEDMKAFAIATLIREKEQLELMLQSVPPGVSSAATAAVRETLAEKLAELKRLTSG